MSTNCLVTRLNAIVENENLKRFAAIEYCPIVESLSSDTFYISLIKKIEEDDVVVEIIEGDNTFKSGQSGYINSEKMRVPYSVNGNGACYLTNGNGITVRIYNYYALWYYKIYTSSVLNNIESLAHLNHDIILDTILFDSQNSLDIPGVTPTGVKGNLNKLNGLKINNIQFTGNVFSLQLTGNFKSFVDAMHEAGKTDGTLIYSINNTGIDFSDMPAVGVPNSGTITFTNNGWTKTA